MNRRTKRRRQNKRKTRRGGAIGIASDITSFVPSVSALWNRMIGGAIKK